MSEESPLGDLREQLDESGPADVDAEAVQKETEEEARGGPAFDFTNDLQRSIYPREESWEELQDTIDFEIKRMLADRDIRDFAGREAHDAMVRLAIQEPERLVELILEARGLDPEELDE